ncbi:SARP family transcriptional regulator [Acrocarpospora pleiomorpha]|uniref:SARP family transcriptional regulator n=1 Tax=Acrocarpospora pleiomorpha TaxID=90975 RepID=A0A5M3XP45_9ACTN|nr:BTAD domain-containing putative transcriptional regulator [Acrocarpospora pleiomorpha]GES21889.1 SARP family transcriptional regulator [Acrocarpospora pleiomorpha]
MEFRVLGPVEAWLHGRQVCAPAGRQRALLAALVLRRGLVVPVDMLVDEVFGEDPPRSARNALQTYVTRLRQALGPLGGVIVTRAPGYVLEAPAEAVDAERFTLLLDQARQSPQALTLLDQALALWRGPMAAELGPDAIRLTELRLAAREDRAAALLALGRATEAAAELEGLAAAEPWRERTVALLMNALAESGRVPAALAAFARHRDNLREELGLDPSATLRNLHQRLLRGEARPVPVAVAVAVAPKPPPGLIGREREIAVVATALAQRPLVTLVGPGGVGKTRLAQQAGERPTWVDLAPLREPETVVAAIAEAAGVRAEPGVEPLGALREWARRADGLLVLDNCEHLLPAVAAAVTALLATGTRLRVLATGREPLGVPGELVVDVQPLTVPNAIELFIARVPVSGFTPDAALLGSIARICAALDGLPLAIELAAARIGSLTVDDLAERLDARFPLLRRTGAGRHHALEDVVDWSFDMLTDDEQRLFLRLSVFAASFDISTAEAVVADDDLPAERVADLMARLADRSMITRPGSAGIGCYRLLETLRVYAASRLPDADRFRRRHAEVLAGFAEEADRGLFGPDEVAWTHRVESRLDDIRAAWAWSRDADPQLMIRLIGPLFRFAYWRLRGDLLRLARPGAAAGSGQCLAATAWEASMAGRLDEALKLAARAVELAPDSPVVTEIFGDIAMFNGTLDDAVAAFQRAHESHEEPAAQAISLGNQALAYSYGGDDAEAAAHADKALALALDSGNPTAICFTRYALAEALADLDPETALELFEAARVTADEIGNRLVSGVVRTASVALRGRHGPAEPALRLFHEVITHWVATESRSLLVTALRNLVLLLARTARDQAAVELAGTLAATTPVASYGIEARRLHTALTAARHRLGPEAYADAWAQGARRSFEETALRALELIPA